MSDPLRDPRFPNRPQHPDFWRLSETAMLLDGRSDEGEQDVALISSEFVDPASLQYAAVQRAGLLLQGIGMQVSPAVEQVVVASIMAGIVHGIAFEKAGGHRDG